MHTSAFECIFSTKASLSGSEIPDDLHNLGTGVKGRSESRDRDEWQ